ncbi:unnamed protein product [Lactuca saligna]|uniref:Uncharacterized protein n=1 Tax=Lactuca saligna TaxID=75948 RepID=A0AA36EJY6_LACSI|nr:unnamed protein product [Lactuca saligna]
MRACAFVSEIWRKKQVNLSILRCYGESRHLHSSYRFVQLPFNASQVVTNQTSMFHNSLIASSIQQCKFFSFASSQTNENETAQPANKPEATMETNNASQTEHPDKKVDSGATDVSQSVKKRRRGTN